MASNTDLQRLFYINALGLTEEEGARLSTSDLKALYVDGGSSAGVPAKKIVENLWWTAEKVWGNLSSIGGIIPSAYNLTTDFISVDPGHYYSVGKEYRFYAGTYYVAHYDENKAFIKRDKYDGVITSDVESFVFIAASEYIRVNVLSIPEENVYLNKGTSLSTPSSPVYVTNDYWDDKVLPAPDGSVSREYIKNFVGTYKPSNAFATPTEVATGYRIPLWLSEDGQMLYGSNGSTLLQSSDEWATQVDVPGTFSNSINAVRVLGDGELLVSCNRDENVSLKAKIFKSNGYNRSDFTGLTWTEVLESSAIYANFNNSWGLQVVDNVVIAGEYGLRGEDGARRAWMSEDNGDTWSLVFDQKTVVAEGRPEWTPDAHLHTVAWDPYWERLWAVTGDFPNTATYFSDDKGVSWTYVIGSDSVQYTGIYPLKGAVLFGSDRSPNGVHVCYRDSKEARPVIVPLKLVDDSASLTSVFGLPFRRSFYSDYPVYFSATPSADSSSYVVATVDGLEAHVVWEGPEKVTGVTWSGEVATTLGPTSSGNMIMVFAEDAGVAGVRIGKVPAPTWERRTY